MRQIFVNQGINGFYQGFGFYLISEILREVLFFPLSMIYDINSRQVSDFVSKYSLVYLTSDLSGYMFEVLGNRVIVSQGQPLDLRLNVFDGYSSQLLNLGYNLFNILFLC
jgi:hypothetical protein